MLGILTYLSTFRFLRSVLTRLTADEGTKGKFFDPRKAAALTAVA